jgi:uncharacterized membrane protein
VNMDRSTEPDRRRTADPNEPVRCPACGHELSMFHTVAPDRGEAFAMRIANAVASWWFPTLVFALIAGWVVWNVTAQPFEPYPTIMFAVISAVLATVAALQGPLILLSQRRAAARDRERDEEALRVAVRSEGDVHRIEAKLDELLARPSTSGPSETRRDDGALR